MIGTTTEPEAVYEPADDEAEWKAVERYETCIHAEACEHATKTFYSKSQEPWNWLYCEKCDAWERSFE